MNFKPSKILHNNTTQLQVMDQQLKINATTSELIAYIVDFHLPNDITNKVAVSCLLNTSENIPSQNLSSKPGIPHCSHESASLTSSNLQQPHLNIDSTLNYSSINNNCTIIVKSSGSHRMSGREIYRIIVPQNTVTPALVIDITSIKFKVEITCISEANEELQNKQTLNKILTFCR